MSFLSQLRERLHALLFRTREEQDLAEELRAHLEMETEANLRRGMSREEARRQALIAFGGVERFKEEVRDARSFGILEDLAQDLRYAARRLTREPGFSVPVIATLALGIGVTAAVFALVNAILMRPLPYPDADRLVTIRHAASKAPLPMNGVSPGTAHHYRGHNRVFEGLGVYVEHIRALTDLETPERVRTALVAPHALPVLRPAVLVGSVTVSDFPPSRFTGVLISHSLWVRRYGADPNIVGRTIEVDHRREVINGVLPPGFGFPHPETDVWEGWHWVEEERNATRAALRSLAYGGVARLRPGVTVQAAQRDLERLVGTFPDVFPEVTAQQLEDMGFRPIVLSLKDAMIGDTRVALLLLMATGTFLLLITWANATNLTLVRAERLRREVAVARALGAGRAHLARRCLSESLVLGLLGGALGLALAALAIDLRFGFAPDDIPRLREVTLDGTTLGVVVALSAASGALLGTVALVSAVGPQVADALGPSRVTASRREQRIRRSLVAAQVALALTLLIGSALMAESFWRLKQVDLGFEPEGILTFRLPVSPNAYQSSNHYHAQAEIHHRVLERVRALPGVEGVEAGNVAGFPLTPVPSFYNERIAVPDRAVASPDAWPYALLSFATPGYFSAMRIPLLRGRTFRFEDTGREAHGVILSASLGRALFRDDDPIGRRVRWARQSNEPDYVVVGLAGDVPSQDIRGGPSNVIYFPNVYPPKADTITGVVHIFIPDDEIYVLRTPLAAASLVPAIQRAVHEVHPKLVITQVRTLSDLVADSMARARLTMLLLLVASATALALGVIGIYGVLSYAVSRRTNELGIRIALGQSPAGVVRMVVRQGARLALAGVAVGLLASFALTRYLRNLLYEVSPSDPAAFVSMAALLLAVAFAASYLPARRAGRIDPVRALRAD